MSLWYCIKCTTAYAVGAPRCPHCGSTSYVEEGKAEMPKITQGAGATHGDDYVPAPDEGDEPAHAVDETPDEIEPDEATVSDEEIAVALTGTVPSILAWINGDRELAARVLAAERATRQAARTSLVAELEKLAA